MFKQASSRNHRSKGLKVKHVLQICLLVAVSVWLLYQVKHSYDKKSALDKSDAKKLENFQSKQEILKLGRKDIDQKEELSSAIHMKHHVEEENEDEDEESKREENEAEGGAGDDEIDKHDQEKIATESAHPEDFGDEEENKAREEEENKEKVEKQEEENKGKEEEDNKVKEEKEEERKDKEPKVEEEGIKEKEEKEESQESKENSHEAREAQYHGDNASSAVSKERVVSERGREDSVKSEEEHAVNSDKNDVEIENRTNGTMDFSTEQIENISTPILQTTENPAVNATELEEKGSEISLSNIENGTLTNSNAENIEKVGEISLFKMENETPTNLTLGNEEKHDGIGLPKSENETYLNSTAKSSDQTSLENNLAEPGKEDISSFMQNETSHLDQNITLKTETASNQERLHSQTVLLEQIEKFNTTAAEAEKQTDSPNSNTRLGEKQSVDSNSPNEFGESKDNHMSSKPDENSETVRIETNGTNLSSVTEEVREAFKDPGTLPDTKSESKNAEGVAAELKIL